MLKNASLAVKLNILVLLVLALLLIGVVFLLIQNTQNLTQEIGGERISSEVNIIQSRLAEVESEILVDTDFVVSSFSFVSAVGLRSQAQTGDIINTANSSLGLDDIKVVDGDGKSLVDTQQDEDTTQEDDLLARALQGRTLTALLIEENDGVTQISLAAAAPVVSSGMGNVLGAIQMSRHISTDFLQTLLFGQDAVYLGVIYEDEIVARSSMSASQPSTVLINNIAPDKDAVFAAQNGELVIIPNLIIGAGGVPHTVAYVPVMTEDGTTDVVIMIVVELNEIFTFQNSTLFNTILIFFTLALFALAIIYVNI